MSHEGDVRGKIGLRPFGAHDFFPFFYYFFFQIAFACNISSSDFLKQRLCQKLL